MEIFTYRTRDGKVYFQFMYAQRNNGKYDVLIVQYPPYKGRSEGASIAHWLTQNDSPSKRKICFTSGSEPKDLQTAKNFSILWSEVTWCYIMTGETIDDQVRRQAPSTQLYIQ